jgi:uncharacterized membrane protein
VAELIGLVLFLLLVLFAVLPILTFLRIVRVSHELEELTARVARLEQRPPLPAPQPAAVPPEPIARPAPPPAPVPSAAVFGSHLPDQPARPNVLAPPDQLVAPDAPVAPDLETRIGGRGLLYIGVLVLLLGVSFFLKYAFDNEWIDERGRVVLGALSGVGLVLGGLRLARGGLQVFGQALTGTGLAILYMAVYSALNFYGLISANTAFVAMVGTTIGAAWIADRQRSQPLAVIAVGGGFLTPFLVGGSENAQLTLFSYDALLVVGTLWLTIRHRWLGLNALSYVFTVITVGGWAIAHYSNDQWLRTLLFLTLFCVLFLIILRVIVGALGWTAKLAALLLSTAPLLYHVAAVVITANHPPAIHVYLIFFTVAGLWLTAEPHRPWLRFLVLLGAFAPMFGTLVLPAGLSWITPNTVTILAVAALHLVAIIDRIVRQEQALATPDLISLHLTGLGLFSLLYEALRPVYPNFRGGLAALVALGAIALWQWLQTRDRVASLNAAALAFTLAALGVAVQFDGPAVVIGWAAEGAAAVWMGLRAPNVTFQYGGLLLWGLAVLELADGYSLTPAGFVALFNLRTFTTFFVVVLGYAMARLFNRYAPASSGRTRAALHVVATVLTLAWITAEIQSYWEVREQTAPAHLYEQMMLSLAWAAYGAVLVVVGMQRDHALTRYLGIAVIAVTSVKVFFYDLWELGGIYRVIGFIVFGVLLVLVSYLYQQRRNVPIQSPPPPPPPSPPQPPASPALQSEEPPSI